MQDPYLPGGCSDADNYFDDDSEPLLSDDDGSERCPVCRNFIDPKMCWCGDYIAKHSFGDGHVPVEMGCACACGYDTPPKSDDSYVDAELHGLPWPSSPIEAASFEYEIAHWS